MIIDKNISKTIPQIKSTLNSQECFDVVYREITIGEKEAALLFIDGFAKDEIIQKLLESLSSVESIKNLNDAQTFIKKYITCAEVSEENSINSISLAILSGLTAFVIDGLDKVILLDIRSYPQRKTSEPEKDRVLRGSRDGFVETLVSNTALIRRRIRSSHLCMKIFNVGKTSKTDVVMCYMDDRADKNLVKNLSDKIKNLNIDSLTMNQQTLAEALYKNKWYNPFPKIKYSERPDSTAASIIGGNIIILVDNSPFAAIIPTSVFDLMEQADDYYFPPVTGIYLRLSRYIITFLTLFVTPVWLLAMQNPEYVPTWLSFIITTKELNVPIIWQLLIIEFSIDGLRLAAMNTPPALNTPLSIIGGIILSDFAVSSGWFISETLLYMAFVAIANYSQSNLELGYALKFMRIILLILTATLNIIGFIIGIILVSIMIISNRTISGKSYLYPLVPFNAAELKRKFFRTDTPAQ